uniref:Uncharacterized protein n=1 Tax=Rhizophora mucronata TaxID=61149 RepID=A0A2P2QIG9_RHIMU
MSDLRRVDKTPTCTELLLLRASKALQRLFSNLSLPWNFCPVSYT